MIFFFKLTTFYLIEIILLHGLTLNKMYMYILFNLNVPSI